VDCSIALKFGSWAQYGPQMLHNCWICSPIHYRTRN